MTLLLNNPLRATANIFVLLITLLTGGCAMSADIELKWEWPAERKPTDRILIKVENIKNKSSGFFAIGASPSLAENVPDPVIITGKIVHGDEFTDGKSLQVTAPKLEVESLKASSYAVVGMIEKNVCICIVPVDSPDIDISSVKCN